MIITVCFNFKDIKDVNSEQAENLINFFQEECSDLLENYKDCGDYGSCSEVWVDDALKGKEQKW